MKLQSIQNQQVQNRTNFGSTPKDSFRCLSKARLSISQASSGHETMGRAYAYLDEATVDPKAFWGAITNFRRYMKPETVFEVRDGSVEFVKPHRKPLKELTADSQMFSEQLQHILHRKGMWDNLDVKKQSKFEQFVHSLQKMGMFFSDGLGSNH